YLVFFFKCLKGGIFLSFVHLHNKIKYTVSEHETNCAQQTQGRNCRVHSEKVFYYSKDCHWQDHLGYRNQKYFHVETILTATKTFCCRVQVNRLLVVGTCKQGKVGIYSQIIKPGPQHSKIDFASEIQVGCGQSHAY